VMLTCTYRSQEEQDALYAQGRTKPGTKVTWTRSSRHSLLLDGKPAAGAFDIAVLSDGKPTWSLKADVNSNNQSDYEEAGVIGERLKLIWGGRWKSPDYPHFQLEA
jgi:peptidoglycan L-alanyl-D-glutamate endopeptidase CwlK